MLIACGIPALTWDEEFTSREATVAIGPRGPRGRKVDPGRIDRVAAALLLQDYLERRAGLTE